MARALFGAHVLVTGATGCIGGRLVERLSVECGARVRVLVRRADSAAGIARFPIDVMVGDVLDPDVLINGARGCSVVFHCVRSNGPDPVLRRAVDVDGPRHVVDAARRSGARVVHVSTTRVYDRPTRGVFDESTPAIPEGRDPCLDAKLEGEQIALADGSRHRVPVVVIQPGIVYGPNAHYSFEMLSELRTSRVILVNGGVGICNVVYVDDVVTALLLAATNDRAHGERFLISGAEHPTWAQFVGAFEAMLGVQRTVSLSEHDALRLWRRSARRRRLIPDSLLAALRTSGWRDDSRRDDELPIRVVPPETVANRARTARISIEKAHRILGYAPVVTLSHGMELTKQWAQSAGLIDGAKTQSGAL